MHSIISRTLARTDKPQHIHVPDGAKPVAFMNRSGDPTIFFQVKGPVASKEELPFLLVMASAQAPDDAIYIGTAEFGGGATLYHCFEVSRKADG